MVKTYLRGRRKWFRQIYIDMVNQGWYTYSVGGRGKGLSTGSIIITRSVIINVRSTFIRKQVLSIMTRKKEEDVLCDRL